MKSILLGLLFGVCALPAFAKDERMSNDMLHILKHHVVGEYNFDIKGLPEAKDFKQPASDEGYEIYRLPTEPHVADSFNYTVVLDKKLQQYWIVQSGGFAGRTTVYGPVALATLKE